MCCCVRALRAAPLLPSVSFSAAAFAPRVALLTSILRCACTASLLPLHRFFPRRAQPLRSSNMADFVPEWDAKYVDVPQELLFELILGT